MTTPSTELTVAAPGIAIRNIDDLDRMSEMFARSGLFKDATDAAKAGVKIMAGQAWGIDPFSAMTGINIIAGKPAIGAHLMAAKVKGSGRYDYRVTVMSDVECSIEFFERGQRIGVSTFTIEDAEKAGTQNLRKFPRNMLFARAMSNGQRWYCPDVFTAPTYTPEELGAQVDGEGNILNVEVVERPVGHGEPQDDDAATNGEDDALITPGQMKALQTIGTRIGFTSRTRAQFREFISELIGRRIASSKELTRLEATQVLNYGADELSEMLDQYNATLRFAAEEAEAKMRAAADANEPEANDEAVQ